MQQAAARGSESDAATGGAGGQLSSLRQGLFLALVFVLPLHTVFVRGWIAWKPLLLLLVGVVVIDLLTWWRDRRWPWRPSVSLALAVLLATLLVGFPGVHKSDGFARLWLAVASGALLLLVTERSLRMKGMLERVLRVQFWSAAALATTAVLFTMAAVGALGRTTLGWINDLPGVFRVAKAAYLDEGFVVLTNWHHEAGYGASWATLWAVLVLVASTRRLASGRWWLDATVIGGLAFGVVAAFSRTAWLVLPVALLTAAVLLVWNRWATVKELIRVLAVAVLITLLLLAVVGLVDPQGEGGDLGLQFAFRWQQGCDLLGSFGLWWATDVGLETAFGASEKRPEVWAWYLDAFLDNPLAGTGLGIGREAIGFEPHNLIIELLGEAGVLGLLAFLLVLGVIIRQGRGLVGTVALLTAFMPLMTLTVFFEPTWWFAAGVLLGGDGGIGKPVLEPEEHDPAHDWVTTRSTF